MAVEITSIQFTDEYSGSGATKNDFLMGSFVDKITAYVSVAIHWETLGIQAAFNTNKTIKRLDNYSFIRDGFKQGDTFEVTGTTAGVNDGSYTIDTITDSTITTIEAIPVTGIYTLVDLNGTTQINAVDFFYNLIENSAALSFVSLTDNQSIQKYSASKANWVATETVNFSTATPSIGWQTGTGSVIKNTDADLASNYRQEFVFTHTFYVAPFFLTGQLIYSEGKYQYPSYFADTNSLKYVARVDGRYDTVNPTAPHTTDPNYPYQLGNVGWFDEFLNGGTPEYTLTSVAYKDTLTNDPLTTVQLDRDTTVTVILASANNHFVSNPQLALNFFICPDDESDYVNTKDNQLVRNFRQDRKLMVIDGSTANGVYYGTDYQALKTISAVANSDVQCTLTFIVSFSQATQTYLLARDENNRKFILMATPEMGGVAEMFDTDRNAVLIDFNSVSYDQDDSTLLTWQDTQFYQYPDTVANPKTDYKGVIGDQVLSRNLFTVDNDSTPIDLTLEIRVVNDSTGDYFVLEKYQQQFPESELQGLICESNLPTVLGYNMASDDPRNQAYLYRNTAIDTASQFGYEFDYGFVMRYETWRYVTEFDTAFACDHSENWSIYSLIDGWNIKHVVTVNVEKDDHTTTFERTSNITLQDGDYSDDGFGGQIVVEKDTYYTGSSGLVDAKGLIFTDQDTHVKLTLTGDFSALPSGATDYYGYLALDVENTGGEKTRDVVTSEEDPLETSVWMTRAMITKVDNSTITIESDIDYTKLDITIKSYLITGRFGFKY